MKQEDKDLLLKDLCARIPYKVQASYYGSEEERETWDEIEGIESSGHIEIGQYILPVEKVKPHLFPLSSMTDEQREEYYNLCSIGIDECDDIICFNTYESIDYLNKNHFDYRNLIVKGLAIDATGLNIY